MNPVSADFRIPAQERLRLMIALTSQEASYVTGEVYDATGDHTPF